MYFKLMQPGKVSSWAFKTVLVTVLCFLFVTCKKEDPPVVPEETVSEAYIVDTIYYETNNMTAYNFVYPSKDPYGKEIMLSGTITFGEAVKPDVPAAGIILYNHFTVYRADQCPTRGDLAAQGMLANTKLITVSADYYGFGATESKHQAYCISRANAQASVDALLAAQKLLSGLGYTWDDKLFNAGYSQGGQTSIGVLRLVAEQYPDIHFTYTFAGGGPYDIPATYKCFLQDSIVVLPSTTISVLLAYNEFCGINAAYSKLFIEPLLSKIDEWFFSKRYTREELDANLGTLAMTDFFSPDILNIQSELSKRFLEVMEYDNLCKGWTPRSDEPVYLFHNTKDDAVPVVNTENLHRFLIAQGATKVTLDVDDYGSLPNMPPHQFGAVFFIQNALSILREIVGEE